VPDRVLGDLHQHRVAALERLLDRAGAALQAGGIPVDLTGVEDRVAAPAKVDEGRFHAGQHVLDPAQVDVADHGGRAGSGDVVLHEDAVLEDADLRPVALLAYHHDPVDRLATSQELGLAEDRRTGAALLATVPAALALGLQPGGAGDALDFVGRLAAVADLDDGGHAVLVDLLDVGPVALAPTTPAAAGQLLAGLLLVGLFLFGLLGLLGGGLLLLGLLLGAALAPAAAAAAAAPAAVIGVTLGVRICLVLFRLDLGLDRFGDLHGLHGFASAPPAAPAAAGLGVGGLFGGRRRLGFARENAVGPLGSLGALRPRGADRRGLGRGLGSHEQDRCSGTAPAGGSGGRLRFLSLLLFQLLLCLGELLVGGLLVLGELYHSAWRGRHDRLGGLGGGGPAAGASGSSGLVLICRGLGVLLLPVRFTGRGVGSRAAAASGPPAGRWLRAVCRRVIGLRHRRSVLGLGRGVVLRSLGGLVVEHPDVLQF
jgi:hypothetical protein